MPEFSKSIKIGKRILASGQAALMIAEIGGNHGGDPKLAEEMIKSAAAANAGAVKFQAYQTKKFLSRQSPYYDELAQEELPFEEILRLARFAQKLDMAAGISVFDEDGIRLAQDGQLDFIKISSGDLTHLPLLEKAAVSQKPLFVSTGAALAAEVAEALAALDPAQELVLMQCAALYPAPLESANLAVLAEWQKNGFLTGFSDHTLGLKAAQAALTLGIVVLEKHFTSDRNLPGGDNAISILPEDFKKLVNWAELCPILWGQKEKAPHPLELEMRPKIQRVLVAAKDLKQGQILQQEDLGFMRPPDDAAKSFFKPGQLKTVLGKELKNSISAGMPLTLHSVRHED